MRASCRCRFGRWRERLCLPGPPESWQLALEWARKNELLPAAPACRARWVTLRNVSFVACSFCLADRCSAQGCPSERHTLVRASYFEFTLKTNRGNFWREISSTAEESHHTQPWYQ